MWMTCKWFAIASLKLHRMFTICRAIQLLQALQDPRLKDTHTYNRMQKRTHSCYSVANELKSTLDFGGKWNIKCQKIQNSKQQQHLIGTCGARDTPKHIVCDDFISCGWKQFRVQTRKKEHSAWRTTNQTAQLNRHRNFKWKWQL